MNTFEILLLVEVGLIAIGQWVHPFWGRRV